MNSLTEMKNILANEYAHGLKGIRFFVEADTNTEDFAHDFCALEKAVAEGNVKKTEVPCS